MHVKMADEAHCVGPAASKESYLNMKKIIEVARLTGAQGIHPGYGFLSENATFADLVESSGLSFIGPSSYPMTQMGDKINSKKVAKAAGCFIIPGFEGEVPDEDAAARLATEVGYPVMIKASAGGGGKGMRIAYNDKEVREGFALSKAEALSSFGDDRMLIERYIEDPHHIEIQVLADKFGNVVAFPERECSVQRRNQKVVEESPSCLLSVETRRLMQEQAIMLCNAVKYTSAGTIELLADSKQNFYFLEMNTRLQVEHPITELVSGEDLVEHMLWIASGKPLPDRLLGVNSEGDKKKGKLDPKGWAIECRVYAEDPLRNFLPCIGPLSTYIEPIRTTPHHPNAENHNDGEQHEHHNPKDVTVRIDTGVREGDSISMFYDPMISKLVTHSPSRRQTVAAMETALDQYYISGLVNNLAFCRSIMRNERFRSGNYSTKFIGQEYPKGFKGEQLTHEETYKLVSSAAAMFYVRKETAKGTIDELYNNASEAAYEEIVLKVTDNNGQINANEEFFHVKASVHEEALLLEVSKHVAGESNKAHKLTLSSLDWASDSPIAVAHFADNQLDTPFYVHFESHGLQAGDGHGGAGDVFNLRFLGSQKRVEIRTLLEHKLSKFILPPDVKDHSNHILCPMPGSLVKLFVQEGQSVEAGQQIAVVEAMKMQNVLRAPKAGKIHKISAKTGQHLKVDQIIVEFEKEAKLNYA